MKKTIVIYLLLFFVHSSCFRPESPILADDIFQFEVSLDEEGYTYFIDLQGQDVLPIATKQDWHLSFSTEASDFEIRINSTSGVAGHKIQNVLFEDIDTNYPVSKIIWDFDVFEQALPFSVFGEWGDFTFDEPQSFRNVFLIRLPHETNPEIFKIQIEGVVDQNYVVRKAKLDGTQDTTLLINRRENIKHTYLNLISNQIIPLEPLKEEWDIAITRFVDTIVYDQSIGKGYTTALNSFLGIFHGIINNDHALFSWDTSFNSSNVTYGAAIKQNYASKATPFDSKKYEYLDDYKPILGIRNRLFYHKELTDEYYYLEIEKYDVEPSGKATMGIVIKSL